MYKLLLCLRYLRRRALAYFAVAGVALCVAMMLIVISVMNGFVRKIERAAKGLFGDVIVEAGSLTGLGRYDEFIAELRRDVPEVEAASPFIFTYGFLQVPGTEYQQTVQVAGVRLPERAEVSDFEDGLFFQRGWPSPTFDPPVEALRRRLDEDAEAIEAIYRRARAAGQPEDLRLADRLRNALDFHGRARLAMEAAQPHQAALREAWEKYAAAQARADDGADDAGLEELGRQLDELIDRSGLQPPDRRVVLGLGIPGLSFRTPKGEVVRVMVPGLKVILAMVPTGRRGTGTITPVKELFTVVDDCSTDVASFDMETVYVPFETLQRLLDLGAVRSADDPSRVAVPARCSQVHVKVRREFGEGRALQDARAKVDRAWTAFQQRHPDAVFPGDQVTVQTWRQRQAKIVQQIESQRTLVVIMFGIISLVAVVLIFVIFYMMVYQKTRDIGVLKAVGASSAGVAGIFLGYGAAIGLVGSILGTIGGYFFVRHINPIHEALGRWFGFQVWDPEWFLFQQIPNEVDPATGGAIVAGAIAAGLLGALIPALRAARMQPVEALRYE